MQKTIKKNAKPFSEFFIRCNPARINKLNLTSDLNVVKMM